MKNPGKVLKVYNLHRSRGGADVAAEATAALLREKGIHVETFVRSSRDLPPGVRGRLKAFISTIYASEAVKSFPAVLDAFCPDIVHIHQVYPMISPWVLPICRERGIPVVMTCHDYRFTCPTYYHFYNGGVCTRCADNREYMCIVNNCRNNFPESVSFGLRNWIARRFRLYSDNISAFMTPSHFARKWMIQAGWPAGQLFAVPNVVEFDAFAKKEGVGDYVAFAGRCSAEKGIPIILAAAKETGLPVRMAGDFAEIKREIDKIRNIKWVGVLDRKQIQDFYRRARFLVVPSVWFETQGLVAAEAMLCETPVIASRIGALIETVDDDVNGLHFETGNPADLAQKMRILWNDPERCRRFGKAGRKKIIELCSKDAFYNNLMSVYRYAMHRPDNQPQFLIRKK